MTAQPYNRFVFVSWSWHLPCNGNQALPFSQAMSNTTAWKLKERTAQTTNVVIWPDLRTSHGRLVWNFLSWDWVLAAIIPFWIMLFILPGLHGLPLQLHYKVFKFNSMWRRNKRILFQIFSIQKITDMLSSIHPLSLYTKLTTVLNEEDWQSMK